MSLDFIKSIYFEFLSYFVVEKQNYEIVGSCNKCGQCCKEIRSYGMKSEKDLRIMQFIFPWYKRFFILRTDKNGEIVLSCKHIKDNGECGIYNLRPFVCRNYPKKRINFNSEMIDGCGYTVIKKEFKDYL